MTIKYVANIAGMIIISEKEPVGWIIYDGCLVIKPKADIYVNGDKINGRKLEADCLHHIVLPNWTMQRSHK